MGGLSQPGAFIMSAPFPWSYEVAVCRVRSELEDIGGKDGLFAHDLSMRYVMVSNYANATYPDKERALIAMKAEKDSEAWKATLIIEGMALSGDMIEANRHVQHTIGNCPAKRRGRHHPDRFISRNRFIYCMIELLQDEVIANMELRKAVEVIADVFEENEDVIIKARQSYIRMMNRNRELEPLICFMAYRYEYERLSSW